MAEVAAADQRRRRSGFALSVLVLVLVGLVGPVILVWLCALVGLLGLRVLAALFALFALRMTAPPRVELGWQRRGRVRATPGPIAVTVM